MTISTVKLLDKAVADDLGLTLSPKTTILKRVVEFPLLIDSFVFAFEEGGYYCYDTVDVVRSINGMRVKLPKFLTTPLIESRLNKRQYRRWYVKGNGLLIPTQTAKTEDLKNTFLFVIGDIPNYQTSIIPPLDTPHLRKKPLMFHRSCYAPC